MVRKKVLFIDDDPDIRDIVSIILEDDGIDLIKVDDVPPLGAIITEEPDLILLDEWLPARKGSALCSELKAISCTAHIPVVLISAVSNLDTIARQCHADAFINKPFDIEELKRVVTDRLAALNHRHNLLAKNLTT